MEKKVTIIDYGMGNILSVTRAFEYWGAVVKVTNSSEAVNRADCLVLPGVGAFSVGMKSLKEMGLIEPIKEAAYSGKPLLGICLGMQMLMDVSEEFGLTSGLGLIAGKVVVIPNIGGNRTLHKLPHIGWNKLLTPSGCNNSWWENSILADTDLGSAVYFVHSYNVVPDSYHNCLAVTLYNGIIISAAVRVGNIYGVQFHPEKSGNVGLHIIKRFLEI